MIAIRRRRARLLLRDGAAASAFAAVALSGTVPPWAMAAFLLALGISILDRRPLGNRPVWSVILLLFAALAMGFIAVKGGLDPIVAACTFACLVTAHRLLSAPTASADHQVQLTSLLTVTGGAALSGELWFGLCLAAFALTSTLSLGLLVLEGPRPFDGELLVRPALQRLALGVVLSLLGGMLFFVFFPRLSWNLAPRRATPGLGANTTGMSDRVRLGGGGDIKSSPRIVVRAKIHPDPRSESLDQYWVGHTFDTFDGREWRGQGTASPARNMVTLEKQDSSPVIQQIELLPGYGAATLIGLDRPVRFNNGTVINASGAQRGALVHFEDEEVRFAEAATAYSYTVTSNSPGRPGPEQELLEVERYTRLPPGVDPRVALKAAEVIAGTRDPQAAAARLVAFFHRDYGYTLELPGDVPDPLADFLFVRRAGHCEHFATALAVMLRTQGFASRVVAGFFGGERIGDFYVVRAGDAHAWTQVFVPGRGWTTFDATPDSGRGAHPSRLLALLTSTWEQLEEWWRLRVVDYSFQDQINLAKSLVRPPQGSPTSEGPNSGVGGPPLAAWFAAAAVGLLVFVVARALASRRKGAHHPAAAFLDELERALGHAGIAQLDGEPIEELTARLNGSAHPLAPAVARAARAYLFARFGGQPVSPQERTQLLGALRAR